VRNNAERGDAENAENAEEVKILLEAILLRALRVSASSAF